MPRDDIEREKVIAEEALFLCRKLTPIVGTCVHNNIFSNNDRVTLSYLGGASTRTTESALLLCAYGQLWDAEMLVRSVVEGSLKTPFENA